MNYQSNIPSDEQSQINVLGALINRESLYIDSAQSKPKLQLSGCTSPQSVTLLMGNRETGNMRENVCQWMYGVVDFCKYDRKITYVA